MRFFGHILHESGCGATTSAGWPHRPARAPLFPRSTVSEHGHETPATPRTSNDQDTGSVSHQRLRTFTGCAGTTTSTPTTGRGKLALGHSGARVRGSGGRPGKKRIRSRARAEEGGILETAEYSEQQMQAMMEYRLRRERGHTEAEAEAGQKAVSAQPASGLRRQFGGGKRRQNALGSSVGSKDTKSHKIMCGRSECGWVTTTAGQK